jgi:hypothetical protein
MAHQPTSSTLVYASIAGSPLPASATSRTASSSHGAALTPHRRALLDHREHRQPLWHRSWPRIWPINTDLPSPTIVAVASFLPVSFSIPPPQNWDPTSSWCSLCHSPLDLLLAHQKWPTAAAQHAMGFPCFQFGQGWIRPDVNNGVSLFLKWLFESTSFTVLNF